MFEKNKLVKKYNVIENRKSYILRNNRIHTLFLQEMINDQKDYYC